MKWLSPENRGLVLLTFWFFQNVRACKQRNKRKIFHWLMKIAGGSAWKLLFCNGRWIWEYLFIWVVTKRSTIKRNKMTSLWMQVNLLPQLSHFCSMNTVTLWFWWYSWRLFKSWRYIRPYPRWNWLPPLKIHNFVAVVTKVVLAMQYIPLQGSADWSL